MASTADGLPRTYSEELPKPRKFSMAELGHKLKSKNTWFGNFDYGFLCTPSWPYCRTQSRSPPQFFGTYDHLGIVTALFMGLQHCLAMTGGLITPPLLVGLASSDPVVQNYLVQAAMLVCAFTTFIQVCGPKIPRLPMLGTGILSVMGVSFASVSTFQNSIAAMMAAGNTFPQAYGRMMGTSAVCCVIPMFISFVPYKYLKRVFPPIVLGVTIMLIGINLTGSGLLNWGGGSYCGTNYKFLPVEQPCTITNNGASYNSTCYDANIIVTCTGNGFVMLPFGSAVYVGLGFLTYATIVVIEIFGSPFMRNGAVVIALLFGYLIAAVTPGPGGQRYVNTALIDAAPVGTFLWTTTFPWGIYTPALIPLFIIFLITSIETMGDVSATEEASRLEVSGPVHTARIKGGLRNDCCSSFFSAVAGSMPITTFAQNNGVISLTGVASRQAGFACALWLLLLGIFGKFGGWVLSIPNCVLGGMTTFLFANVISSGIKILVSHGPLTRRDRFILACSLGLGIGISIVPYFFENAMWPADPSYSEGLASLQAAILNVLATPFCVGALIALTLNLVLPVDAPEVVPVTSDASDSKHVTLFEKQTSAGSRDGSLSGPSDDKAPTTALHLHLDKQQAGGMAGRGDGVGAGAYTPPAPQAAMLSDD